MPISVPKTPADEMKYIFGVVRRDGPDSKRHRDTSEAIPGAHRARNLRPDVCGKERNWGVEFVSGMRLKAYEKAQGLNKRTMPGAARTWFIVTPTDHCGRASTTPTWRLGDPRVRGRGPRVVRNTSPLNSPASGDFRALRHSTALASIGLQFIGAGFQGRPDYIPGRRG